jgi:geranylgeranyl pyrophosphate synthase
MQDVDDLINIVEEREAQGENADLKMGIPSYPLLAALQAEPAARHLLAAVWDRYRARHRYADRGTLDEAGDTTDAAYRELVALVCHHGIPATTEKVIRDAESVVAHTPEHVRAAVREYAFSIVDRLRDCDPRSRIDKHLT